MPPEELDAAFIFAVQMLNFPVAAGTSGHLLGGALAAILVGPFTGVLCVSVVLLMQGLQGDLLPADDRAAQLLGVPLHSFDAAVAHALREWERLEPLAAR